MVENMDSEDAEFIWDVFPKFSLEKRKIEKFSHMTDLGYKVQNICAVCYQTALKKSGELS
nr:hypothetical protein [Candidatus Prometheoarchaeum syntrophicum]